MKKYKVSALASEMGVSPDLLKLYEEYGLLAPQRDPDSQYRYYDIYHGGQLVSCLTLRNMGFSVRQTAELIGGTEIAQVRRAILERKAGLEAERSRLDRLIPAAEDFAALCGAFAEAVRAPERCVRPGYYFLAQAQREEFRQSERQKKLARRLLDELPWSERLLVISRASFAPDEEFSFQWGLGLREDLAEGWPVEEMRYLPPAHCMRLLENHEAIPVSRESFQSVAAYLDGGGFGLAGDVVCRVPMPTTEQGKKVAHRAVYLPLEGLG